MASSSKGAAESAPKSTMAEEEEMTAAFLKQGMNKVSVGYTSFGMYTADGRNIYESSESSDSDSSSDSGDDGGMEINVHVIDKSFNRSAVRTVAEVDHTFSVRVGEGKQTLRWLTLVVMERLEAKVKRSGNLRKSRGTPGRFKPQTVVSGDPETDAEFLTPDAKLNEVLVDGEDLYVYLHQDGSDDTAWEKQAFGSNQSRDRERFFPDKKKKKVVPKPKQKKKKGAIWSTDSIFIVKALESDSHSFYDTDHVLQRAAKADWSHCKKPRFLSDEADQKMVLATLKNHYRTLKELFRYYSAVGDGNPFCIQYNSFLTMVKHFGMNPSHLGCDVIFKECNFEREKDKENDDDSLTRYEFMEIMVRLAHKKYGRSKDSDGDDLNPGEELQKLLDDHVLPTAFLNSTINGKARPKFFADSDWFRRERLYFEEVDKVLSAHVDDLLLLYLAYRDDESSDGKLAASIFLSFPEFLCLLEDAKLFEDAKFTRREAKLAFVYSQMTTVDEVERKGRAALRDAHDQSTFSEFLESLCRCAEMAFDEEEDGIPWNAPLSLKVAIFLRLLLYGHRRVLVEEKAKLRKHAASSLKGEAKGFRAAGKRILKRALGKASKKRKVPEQGPEYKRIEPKTTAPLPKVDDFFVKRIEQRKQRVLEQE